MLTPEQQERFALLQENAAGLIHIISKIERHGLDSHNPITGEKNTTLLLQEIADTLIAIKLVAIGEHANMQEITSIFLERQKEKGKYLHSEYNKISLNSLLPVIL